MIQAGFQAERLPHWGALDVALAESGERNPVRAEFALAAHDSDRAMHARVSPVRARQRAATSAAVRAAGAGLVSVPSSPERACSAVETVEIAEALDAVLITAEAKAKRRLSSLRRSVGFAARAHAVCAKGYRSDVPWMVTFTYRPGVQWHAKHVSDALRHMYHWCKRKGFAFRYVWIAEIQDGKRRADGRGRDVIHYHAVVWLPVGVRCPHFDRRGWWPHGMSRADPPVSVNNPVGYVLHYLKKDKDLSAMPKGARAYGVGGLDHALRRARRWLGLPAFVQGNSSINDQWRRAVGGGWVDPDGVWYASEFQRTKIGGLDALIRVHRHATQLDASGPFSWVSDRVIALQ